MVWGYSSAWFLVNDRVKLLAYRIFDSVKPVKVNKPSDLTPRIAERCIV
jgi:H+-transporting ATPase